MKISFLRRTLLFTSCACALSAADITSPGSVTAKSGDFVSYQITSTVGNVVNSGAWDLPPGLSCNSSGYISGTISLTTSTGAVVTYYGGVYQDDGAEEPESASSGLDWIITPIRQAVSSPSIVPTSVQQVSQTVTLTRNGSAYNGITWAETIITRPNGSTITTSYSGLGSAGYIPDGGVGEYTYELKVGDSTGASLVSSPVLFYAGEVTPFYFSPTGPIKVGQTVTIKFSSDSGPFSTTGTSVTVNTATDTVISTSAAPTTPSSFKETTAQLRPLARDNGLHWIWMAVSSGNWWGKGLFLSVEKATPTQSTPYASLSGGSSGFHTLASGELTTTLTNPYHSSLSVGGASQVVFRLAFSNVTLTPGTQLPSGAHLVEATYPGNNDYNSVSSRGFVYVTGPYTPSSLRAGVTGASTVSVTWAASAYADHYEVFRDSVSLGTTTATAFVDTTATDGATATYSVKAINAGGLVSALASITLNALEVFTPGI